MYQNMAIPIVTNMARPKKVTSSEIVQVSETTPKAELTHLSVDYPSEGLNNIAIKINQIIDILNHGRH